MQVILNENVRGLGQKGEVKDVNPGYARNFLIPKGLASPASKKAASDVKQQAQEQTQKDQDLKKILQALKKDTNKNPIPVEIEVGEKGQIFSSLQEEELAKALGAHRLVKNLNFKVSIKPTKKLGIHQATIDLGRGVKDEFTFELKAAA